jgi:hypothetical protein
MLCGGSVFSVSLVSSLLAGIQTCAGGIVNAVWGVCLFCFAGEFSSGGHPDLSRRNCECRQPSGHGGGACSRPRKSRATERALELFSGQQQQPAMGAEPSQRAV